MGLGEIRRRFRKGEAVKRGDWSGQKVLGQAGAGTGRHQRGRSSAAGASASIFRELGASSKAGHRWEGWAFGLEIGPHC